MKYLILVAVVLLASAAQASATWSVVAVDQSTGTVVIASATCKSLAEFVPMKATGLMDIQAIIVPGKAVAAAQANVDTTRANQQLIFRELQKGTSPAEIIQILKEDPNFEARQFGIVDLKGRSAGFSGTKTREASLDVQGRVVGRRIFFSIQGNILANEAVVRDAVKAFETASGGLTDRVMAAMDVADRNGGDVRCNCNTPPRLPVTCDAKTAHVAYVLRAEPTDTNGSSYNDGHYALYISVTDQNIAPNENANPVRTLRMRYDAWKKAHPQASAGRAAARGRAADGSASGRRNR